MRKQPDFIYIGLKRSASTFLRGYFDCHPDIVWQREGLNLLYDALFCGGRLETEREVPEGSKFIIANEFLATGPIIGSGPDWEKNRLRPGLSSTASGCRMDSSEIARGIKHAYPAAGVVLVLRNQIDWFRTHYRVFMPDLPPRQHRFRDFLTTPEGQVLLNGGFYDRALETYFDVFGRQNVHVALFEDIRDNEEAVLRSLCAFLGVREAPYDPRYRRYNSGPSDAEIKVKSWIAATGLNLQKLRALRPLAQAIRARLPTKWLSADPISEDERYTIAGVYAVSNQHTARLIGRDLAALGYPL
jgi:hypothetical protein